MKIEEVYELIIQNGIGHNIRCFFSSTEIERNKDHMSIINNYKHHKGVLKLYLDRFHFEEHSKVLAKYPDCELLIKRDNSEQSDTIRVFCKFLRTDNQFIYARIFKVKYIDDFGKEVSKSIMLDDKKME